MANEAIPVEGPYEVHDFTVATGTNIPINTILKLSDPRTAAASSAADVFAGIAASEKSILAGDLSDTLGCYVRGVFTLTAAPTANTPITAGSLVSLSGPNLIKLATEAEVVTGAAFGKSWETIAGATTGDVHVGYF